MARAAPTPLKRHIEESPKLRELRRKKYVKRRRLFILLTILFLALFAGFIYAAHHPHFQITTVQVSGNQVVDTDKVVSRVDTLLEDSYLYLVPHRNAFFYPKKEIVANLLATFPRFKSVVVYRTNLHTLQVSVVEVRGKALWCGTDILNLPMSAPCYFTDSTGKIVAEAPMYSGNVYPRFFGGSISPSEKNPLSKTFVDEKQFSDLIVFADQVTKLGLSVKAIVIGTGDEDSFSIDLGAGKSAVVRFLKSDNFQTLDGNLSAALAKDALVAAIKKDKSNLEYFDLRFTNKVYYKFSDH